MMRVKFAGECCTDCLLLMANGECGEDTATHAEAMEAHLGADVAHAVATCCEDTGTCVEFSWQACDACGSRLGGERHRFAVLAPADRPKDAAAAATKGH